MKLTVLRAIDRNYSVWSGGKTAQLEIFPAEAVYADRKFLYRISTATIEVLESDFTKLPGFARKLMLLEGELKLEFEHIRQHKLKQMEVVTFDGGWNVRSFGKCTDFNLMTAAGSVGLLEALTLKKKQKHKIIIEPNLFAAAFFVVSGTCNFTFEREQYILESGDYISLHNANELQQIQLVANENSNLACVKVWIGK